MRFLSGPFVRAEGLDGLHCPGLFFLGSRAALQRNKARRTCSTQSGAQMWMRQGNGWDQNQNVQFVISAWTIVTAAG